MTTNSMLNLLVYLLLGGLVIYAVYWILGMIDLPPEVKRTVTVVFAVFVLIWLIWTIAPGLIP